METSERAAVIFSIDARLKERFKACCDYFGFTMTEVVVKHIEEEVRNMEHRIDFFQNRKRDWIRRAATAPMDDLEKRLAELQAIVKGSKSMVHGQEDVELKIIEEELRHRTQGAEDYSDYDGSSPEPIDATPPDVTAIPIA